jgi:hypothetical protein
MAAERDPASLADRVMDMVHAFGSERLKDDATLALVTVAPTRGEQVRDLQDPHAVSP